MNAPSRELVPVEYGLASFNTLHGTELRYHTDKFTPEEAAAVREGVQLEVRTGRHGFGVDLPNKAPTQEEFREFGGIVRGMQPGDKLLVEGIGFSVPHEFSFSNMSELEEACLRKDVNVFEYAAELARLMGIEVIGADINAFETSLIVPLLGGKSLFHRSNKAIFKRVDAMRERKARNVMKDTALDALHESKARQDGHKPRVVLLFGGKHKNALQKNFLDIGLDAEFIPMKATGRIRRLAEWVLGSELPKLRNKSHA